MNNQRIVTLTPPQLSPSHIQEKIICIRAHRERIFQVSAQYLGDKLICHNYGQGGAGWTFLFGCVHESIRQFEDAQAQSHLLNDKQIAVIGAGCYGLLTAVLLARKGHAVRIIAKEIDNLPSYKAAGFFFPRPRKSSTPAETAQFLSAGMESYATYLTIINGTHPFISHGAKKLPCYYGLDIDPGLAPYIAQGLVEEPEKVVIDFGTGKTYQAMAYNTLFIDAASMMAELCRNIRELHIPITAAAITDFNEIPESIIFNCTSLGAKKLVDDKRLIPVQGHLITLKNQPPTEQLQYMINVKVLSTNARGMPRDELIYYAPKGSGILGITFLRGEDSTTANQHEFDRLITRCQQFFGS